jgi:hypothetical protein
MAKMRLSPKARGRIQQISLFGHAREDATIGEAYQLRSNAANDPHFRHVASLMANKIDGLVFLVRDCSWNEADVPPARENIRFQG